MTSEESEVRTTEEITAAEDLSAAAVTDTEQAAAETDAEQTAAVTDAEQTSAVTDAEQTAAEGTAALGVDEITDWTEVMDLSGIPGEDYVFEKPESNMTMASPARTVAIDAVTSWNTGLDETEAARTMTMTMTRTSVTEGDEDEPGDSAEDGTVRVGRQDGEDAGEGEGSEGSEGAGGDDKPKTGLEEDKAEEETDPETEAIKEKIRERKREKKRKARQRRTRFWTILTILLLSIGGFLFSISGFFTVDLIEVEGNSHFSDEEIINIAHAGPGRNLIYDTDKTSIIDYLMQNPYIKSADVTRKLPSTLVITVEERTQACVFKYDDDFLVMDDEGILLKKTRTQPKTTMVTGMVVTKLKLGEVVGTKNQSMFSRTLKLIRATKDADLYFVMIDMTQYEEDRSVTAYIYDKLMIKTEYDTLMTFLKNGRLHKVVEKLFADDIKRGTILLTDDGNASFEPGI